MKSINVILFDDFTALDVFGAVEVLSRLDDKFELNYFSQNGGRVKNSINLSIDTQKFSDIKRHDILLVPGGFGTRNLINDEEFLVNLKELANKSEFVLSVCTGSVLLAYTGLLNGLKATSNKSSWQWVISQNLDIKWQKDARFVKDGKFYTGAGVSAGIDMALAFAADICGIERARSIARAMEYVWSESERDLIFS